MHAAKEAVAVRHGHTKATCWVCLTRDLKFRIDAEVVGRSVEVDVFNDEGGRRVAATLQYPGVTNELLTLWLARNGLRVVAQALKNKETA